MLSNTKIKCFGMLKIVAGLSAMALMFGSISAYGASISDGNSTVTFNPSASDNVTPFVSQWIVDGINQYGGSPAGGESPGYYLGPAGEKSINLLTVQSSSFSGGIAAVTYLADGFTIAVRDVLTGGSLGSGSSAINETVTVNNTSSSPLAFSFADFVNPNVNAMPNDDTLTLSLSAADQTNASGVDVKFTVTPSPVTSAESTHGNTGPFLEQFGTYTGDAAFAFIWGSVSGQNTIDAGGTATFNISQTVTGPGSIGSVVPLPNSAAVTLVGLVGFGMIRIVRRFLRVAI